MRSYDWLFLAAICRSRLQAYNVRRGSRPIPMTKAVTYHLPQLNGG